MESSTLPWAVYETVEADVSLINDVLPSSHLVSFLTSKAHLHIPMNT